MLPAVVLLDAHDRLLRRSIQQSDGRTGREVEELAAQVDPRAFVQRTGNGINQQLVAAKLRWLEKHEPQVFRRVADRSSTDETGCTHTRLTLPSSWDFLVGEAGFNPRPPAPKAGALPGCATPRSDQ